MTFSNSENLLLTLVQLRRTCWNEFINMSHAKIRATVWKWWYLKYSGIFVNFDLKEEYFRNFGRATPVIFFLMISFFGFHNHSVFRFSSKLSTSLHHDFFIWPSFGMPLMVLESWDDKLQDLTNLSPCRCWSTPESDKNASKTSNFSHCFLVTF